MSSFFHDLSLRRKQMLIILLTTAVALILACAAFVFYDVLDFRHELVARISGIAQVIAEHSTASLDFSDPKTAEQTLAALDTEQEVVAGCIYDRSGRVFAVYTREPHAQFNPPPAKTDGYKFAENRLRLFRPVMEGEETIGSIYVESDLRELPPPVHPYLEIAGLDFVVSLLAALAISTRLERVVSGPILRLATIARSVAVEKNYSVRADGSRRDELGQLINGFNEMLAQIQQRDNALQSARDNLEHRVEQRTNELASSLSLLNATLNSTADAIVAIDLNGRVMCCNERFAAMWNIPPNMIERANNEEIIQHSASQVEAPEEYLNRIGELRAHPEDVSVDVLNMRDGRTVERFIHPQLMDGKRIGSVLTFRDITERKKAEASLQKAHEELVQTSRQAGMAEVATNVLHNVGNVLNSVNTSATIVMDQVRASRLKGISRLVELFDQHKEDLAEFLTRDNRRQQVVEYLKTLSNFLAAEQAAMLGELSGLVKNIEHIKQIVAMQQSYAKVSGVEEIHSPASMLEDALRIHQGNLDHNRIRVVREFEAVPDIVVDKHKVLQILINLIGNAKYAVTEIETRQRQITLAMKPEGTDRIQISVSDNGVGIARENLIRIFSHGFTTRKHGHGFGLHSGFLAAKEMGGSLSVYSEGSGKGAVFTLELPVRGSLQEKEVNGSNGVAAR